MIGVNHVCEIFVEFAGGLSAFTVDKRRRLKIEIQTESVTVSQLVAYLRKAAFAAKRDLFAYPPKLEAIRCSEVEVRGDLPGVFNMGETSDVIPGVIVLIDDTDLELLGGSGHKLKGKRDVSFISSLHGG
ncbi:Ubiquitin related modifier 1, putative [Babesia bigemina]|uniref:Ubiquitin-related modifier 1 homolog n=1 Tax=Babesia bigemina TaxID=5866 RepID=A0A061D687_BABBI|nr:Ubiquitin related modifier 1, putative [Babesia bigemina]CDR96206.1 Ubiquitin related modifier 1, putative [Babesia bigemina]|eukprot:XP_012768392.1 Ubiquitin related modifier 1, putative [Babesia bigemina]